MNGFRSRGLVLEESDFLEAREAFLAQLSRPCRHYRPRAIAPTPSPAGWLRVSVCGR